MSTFLVLFVVAVLRWMCVPRDGKESVPNFVLALGAAAANASNVPVVKDRLNERGVLFCSVRADGLTGNTTGSSGLFRWDGKQFRG